ncbi:MAG: NAD(P)/FAD-dependent oxidoreductase [Deltaproteobacteria bacterium]|nr:NAD(P)/FAD-dependent oxidoreductase [Deltaproteobacteria bacterium]
MSEHHSVVIVGGGTGGLTVAARLCASPNPPKVAIIEPSEKHYYQPIWTLVGGGVFPKEISERDEAEFIPNGATWIKDAVASFAPDKNELTTKGGKTITYDQLVIAAGIQLEWGKVKGLEGEVGKNGICSNYSYQTVESTYKALQGFKGGNAVFTHPNTPIKCGGAPQKIMYLAEEFFRKSGVRKQSNLHFYIATPKIFSVPKYADALMNVCAKRGIENHFSQDLVEVRPSSKEAVFRGVLDGSESVVKYDMLHVTPPMGAPTFLKQSGLGNEGGWIEVDKHTLQHVRHENVFALGDCSNLPTSKTGAAIRKQAPAVVENVLALRAGKALTGHYDGYTSCPLVTGYGKLILAEFDYNLVPQESFAFDQSQERYSMYALKAYALPQMYWHGMLRGRL